MTATTSATLSAARGLAGAAALALLPAAARAEPWSRGAASLEYEARYVHAVERDDDAPDRGVDGLGLAGLRLRGQLGGDVVAYRAGIELTAGATAPAGFAYDCALYPLGVGLRLGAWSRLGVVGGVAAAGATGTVDDAVLLPAEASLELALGGRLRVLARARLSWVAAAPGRQDGAVTATFADELDASLAVRWGRRGDRWGVLGGRGTYVGVAYREAEGARMIGVVLGHSIDAASR